jgi:hypothetical protein
VVPNGAPNREDDIRGSGAPSPKAFARSSPNLLQEESGMPRSKRGSQPREKRRGVDDAFKKVRGARERHCHQPANECQLSPAPPRTPQGTHHQSRQPVTFTSVRRPQRHHALRGGQDSDQTTKSNTFGVRPEPNSPWWPAPPPGVPHMRPSKAPKW